MNGERIRSSTDKELVERFLTGKCPPPSLGRCSAYDTCVECWMEWLGKEEDDE